MLLHAQEKPGPEHGHQQLPVEFGQRMQLRVASEDLVLIASPGQCEVSHAVVPVARFEVEDAAEPFILEEQVPAREVAVAVDPCSSASNRPRVRRSAGQSSSDAPDNRSRRHQVLSASRVGSRISCGTGQPSRRRYCWTCSS